MRSLVLLILFLAFIVVIGVLFRLHRGDRAQTPIPLVPGIPAVTDPQVLREQSYGRRVAYIASKAPSLDRVSLGPLVRTVHSRVGGFENGLVTDNGIMYVTQALTVPQGTMRQFYSLSTLWAGHLTPVQLPAPSKNPASFPGYLYLGFDARSHGNRTLVDASDYEGHQFVLAIKGQQSAIIRGLRRADEYFVNGFEDGSRCVHAEGSASSPYMLWSVNTAGRKVPLLSRAELARATGGILDNTYKTSIDLTCGYFARQNFITVSSPVVGFILRWSGGHASIFSPGIFQVSGGRHALITVVGTAARPGESLELFSRQASRNSWPRTIRTVERK